MPSRWKNIAMRIVQTSAQRQTGARLASRTLNLPARGNRSGRCQPLRVTGLSRAKVAGCLISPDINKETGNA